MTLSLDEAIKIANQAMQNRFGRKLSDMEIQIFKGAWHRHDYDKIAAQTQYSTSYLSQDIAPKLWRSLTEALGEKVKKTSFKEALKRYWRTQALPTKNLQYSGGATGSPTELRENAPRLKEFSPSFEPNATTSSTPSPIIYIPRPEIEAVCRQTLMQPGALLRLKAPSQMGKTCLIRQVLTQLAHGNYKTAYLSLKLADRQTHFNYLNKLLRWLCLNLSRGLEIPSLLEDYWDEDGMGSKVSCTTYLGDYLLAQISQPLVICLDDVDLLFPYSELYEDFFGLVRSWYELARSQQRWQRLRLVITHSTDAYIRLNLNQSPFNVGVPIELGEFGHSQVLQLAQQFQQAQQLSPFDSGELELLQTLVGGHPYLLHQTLIQLQCHPHLSLTQLLQDATTDAGIYGHHLRQYWLNLQEHPPIMEALGQLVQAQEPMKLEPMVTHQLHSMGLVKLSGNCAELRCQLYHQYFRDRLDIA
jgi:hypothetical protein